MAYIWISFILLICGLVVIRPTIAEMCSPDNTSPKQVVGKFGQSLSIIGETQDTVLFSKWTRQITGQDNVAVTLTLVSYIGGENIWGDNSTNRPYSAAFTTEGGKSAYTFQFTRLNCHERGIFTCGFHHMNSHCETKFNVNITADPLAPFLKNATIRGDAGSTVNVMCEANVGYPAGEIWWYYIPDDGSSGHRLQSDPADLSSAEDCRSYAKSTLAIQLKSDDNNSKIRCTTRTVTGQQSPDYAEAKIIINGMDSATTPEPCIGNDCATTGAVDIRASVLTSALTLFLPVVISSGFLYKS